ncbi:MAG: methionyl-tRNA formyltransferase [Phycisphaerae bacterium]
MSQPPVSQQPVNQPPTGPRLRVLFAGGGPFGLPTLTALPARHEVVGVVTQPDKPAGRGRKLTPTLIADAAVQLGLPVIKTPDINVETLPETDVLVVIAFGQKLAAEVCDRPRLGSINLHASLLPAWRGAAPIHHAVMAGDRVTGNTVIRLAEKMDAGQMLGTVRTLITDTDTTGDVHDRLAELGVPLVLRVLDELAAGTAREVPQDHAAATQARKLNREQAVADFTLPAVAAARRVNGLSPWPGCHVRLLDGDAETDRLTLVRVRPVDDSPTHALTTTRPPEAGTVNEAGHITCGDGLAVEVLQVKPEGRPVMPLADYRNGKPWRVGMRLTA